MSAALTIRTSSREGTSWHTAQTGIILAANGGTLPDWTHKAVRSRRMGDSGGTPDYMPNHNESYFWAVYEIDSLTPEDQAYVNRCIAAQEARERLGKIQSTGKLWTEFAHGGHTAEASKYVSDGDDVWCAGFCGSPDHYLRAAREIVQYAVEMGVMTAEEAIEGPFQKGYWTRPSVAAGGFMWEPHEEATLAFLVGWKSVKAQAKKGSPEHMEIVASVARGMAAAIGHNVSLTLSRREHARFAGADQDWAEMIRLVAVPDGPVHVAYHVGGSSYSALVSEPQRLTEVGVDGTAIVALSSWTE